MITATNNDNNKINKTKTNKNKKYKKGEEKTPLKMYYEKTQHANFRGNGLLSSYKTTRKQLLNVKR